jgi:hypothetical protein
LFCTAIRQDSKLILGANVAVTRSTLWGFRNDFDPLFGFSSGIDLAYILSTHDLKKKLSIKKSRKQISGLQALNYAVRIY